MSAHSHNSNEIDVSSAISYVRSRISSAEANMEAMHDYRDDSSSVCVFAKQASDDVATAFTQLMILADALGLKDTHDRMQSSFEKAQNAANGLSTFELDPYGEGHLCATGPLRHFVAGFEGLFCLKTSRTVSKDIVEILRGTQYAITNRDCFPNMPCNEADVHNRIEAVLKCVFPDLRRKPSISKPIKNFEPDTGIPSTRTLIEYKFVQTKIEAKRVADEILADTRGYKSKDWDNFVFLIYETTRLTPEHEWNDLLRDCGTALTMQAIVICGEPVAKKKGTKKGA